MIVGISPTAEAMRRFVSKVHPGKPILIGGEPGVGKRHLARKIVATYYKNDGVRSAYARIVDAAVGLPDPLTDEIVLTDERSVFDELSARISQSLWIAPLRERLEDIPPFLEHFVTRTDDYEFWCSQENLAKLLAYWWPFNVAELRRVTSTKEGAKDLPFFRLREMLAQIPANKLVAIKMEGFWDEVGKHTRPGAFFRLLLESIEREFIKTALKRCQWQIGETATLLSMHRNTLNQKIRKYRIAKKN